jgi:alkylation response protein AidB-like acyl-CoA dehydrogenase
VATLLVDKRDQQFVLNEMLEIDRLRKFPKFSDHSGFDMVLTEAHRFAKAEFFPTMEEADRVGCVFDPKEKTVKFPECFHKPYAKFCEGGWLAMSDSPEVGGDGYPLTVGTAVSEVFYAGGFYIYGAAELSHASAKVIETYGTPEQKSLYMSRLYSGEWMGAMCLTEADAGSDVGMVQSTARPNPDGSYQITGTKIFITAGEHDMVENIIHMVLARVEGDSPGTKGLSLFIVPKHLSDAEGRLTKRNDVYCTGIEHKMGLHGLVTCTMAYGDSGQCTGFLLGKQGHGIIEMFHMMNEQRLLVGLEGLAFSSAAFLHAVEYTLKRVQGRSVYPADSKKQEPVAIIQHPDVKRMLLAMKGYVEGERALAYFASSCIDYAGVTEGEEQAEWQGLLELLIPIVKAYLTENSWLVTGLAIQCAGGYGYCADYPFERLARDCKVTTLFEGTNGIQSIDLVFRKLIANKGVNFKRLMARIDQTVQAAEKISGLSAEAAMVNRARAALETAANDLMEKAKGEDAIDLYAGTVPFLEAMGDVIMGWLHLWQLTIAYPKLGEVADAVPTPESIQQIKKVKSGTFYYGKIQSSRYFIGSIMVRVFGKIEALKSNVKPVIHMLDSGFTG